MRPPSVRNKNIWNLDQFQKGCFVIISLCGSCKRLPSVRDCVRRERSLLFVPPPRWTWKLINNFIWRWPKTNHIREKSNAPRLSPNNWIIWKTMNHKSHEKTTDAVRTTRISSMLHPHAIWKPQQSHNWRLMGKKETILGVPLRVELLHPPHSMQSVPF